MAFKIVFGAFGIDQNLGAVDLKSTATVILALLAESSHTFASTGLLIVSSHTSGQVTRNFWSICLILFLCVFFNAFLDAPMDTIFSILGAKMGPK